LPATALIEERIALVHGGVRDIQLYMTTPRHISQNAEFLRADFPTAQVCFFGHSHAQKVYEVAADEVSEKEAPDILELNKENLYFVNPGSVDAQRKREHKLAECAIFDSLGWTVEFLRVPYDAASTEAKAAVFGYRINPLTDRLYSLQRQLYTLPRRLLESDSRRR
jgi:predicted phosphodiesterase